MRSRGLTLPLLTLVVLGPWSSQRNTLSKQRVLFASAALTNFTLDDTSSLITYSPATTWRPSTVACDICLGPDTGLAYAGTWHDGTHIIPTVDADDLPGGVEDHSSSKQGKPSSTSHAFAPAQTTSNGNSGSGGGGGDGKDKVKRDDGRDFRRRKVTRTTRHMKEQRRDNSSDGGNPFFREKMDSDDAGFVDTPVSMAFDFIGASRLPGAPPLYSRFYRRSSKRCQSPEELGSAVYVYALLPLFAAPSNTTPTFVNLTYTLDSQPIGQFLHSGSPSVKPDPSLYLSSALVFQKSGLTEGSHTLNVTVGPDSVLLLDYIVYSRDSQFGIGSGSSNQPTSSNAAGGDSGSQPTTSLGTASMTGALNMATSTTSPSSKSHNVATFAGAVGGSVGLLSVLALSLAFSIYRRRVKARRRDLAYRQSRGGEAPSVNSFHTEASEDGPPMQGPAPFVPRYFPGTVINTAPPAYSPPAPPSNDVTSALLGPGAPEPSIPWSSRRSAGATGDSDSASYADRPPPTPPLNPLAGAAEVEDMYFAPPPSFQVAIASPIPAILAGLSGITTPESPAPTTQPPSPSPPSPIVPLLAPPPSARPVSLTILPLQTPGAGPSDSRTSLTVPLEPTVSTRASLQSLRTQPSEDESSEPNDPSPRPSRYSYPSLRSDSAVASSSAITASQHSAERGGGGDQVMSDEREGNTSSH
ncbi:hypothetical protein BDY19DRAFT_997838 [Irpex rosettiformis]|uniref:Uncharacterized protein n=1 Tax=Irpex rosettiformis TaxID=378272 RepID=A0ACB8TQV7_9APHY|nr:hypothetical protein BDY19DRAFT_997838 [Irpex rosettiformis]